MVISSYRMRTAEILQSTQDPADILQKLEQLNDTQIAVIKQLTDEQAHKLSAVFKTLLNGVLSQKNIVHGNISNVKMVKIGDEINYHYHTGKHTIPKSLTAKIPRTSQEKIVGREAELEDLHRRLFDNKQVLLVNGLGGIGKTTLAQVYTAKYWDEYRHIAWINQISEDYINDFITTGGLLNNLNIQSENKESGELFTDIVSAFNKIDDKPNLLVIDNADTSLSQWYDYLPAQSLWHILVTSRARIHKFDLKELDFLSENEAIALFLRHYTLGKIDRNEIKELVTSLDRHTLTIEFLAKSAQTQRTGINQLKKANVYVNHKGDKIGKVTSYLSSIFSMSKLSSGEIWLLKQFVCLPAEFHGYELLKELINPKASQEEDIFPETVEMLTAKGWLLQNSAADSYKMHRIIADVIKKQQIDK